jgi:phospholipid/cholesterol/gamma-HCH transport system permease protein
VGERTVAVLDEIGYCAVLVFQSVYWLAVGPRARQPVRLGATIDSMIDFGVQALPIATLLAATIGIMLAIQSLYSLGLFGAQQYAYIGIALSVAREFSPIIMGILVAGRSGSALAARIGSMTINQEIDALDVMGINPVRFLVTPALLGFLVMLPCLTMWANFVSIIAAGFYVSAVLHGTLAGYLRDTLDVLHAKDLWQGLGKSVLFGLIIAVIGAVNGSNAKKGAEDVGRVTTRAVVQSITLIVVTDMIFAYLTTH